MQIDARQRRKQPLRLSRQGIRQARDRRSLRPRIRNKRGFSTNLNETYFSLLKRGVYGVFHHVSEAHLHRYTTEFDFRWNTRAALGMTDADRAALAVKGVEGKRLLYRGTSSNPTP
jgi:hypothetical protein